MTKRKMTRKRKTTRKRSQSDNLSHATTMVHLVPDGVHMHLDGLARAGVHHFGTNWCYHCSSITLTSTLVCVWYLRYFHTMFIVCIVSVLLK